MDKGGKLSDDAILEERGGKFRFGERKRWMLETGKMRKRMERKQRTGRKAKDGFFWAVGEKTTG